MALARIVLFPSRCPRKHLAALDGQVGLLHGEHLNFLPLGGGLE